MVSDASGTVPAKGARYVALVLLMIVYAFNYLDRQIVSVLAEPIKNDLHLSDAEIGMLGGLVFALFYTAFGIPLAYMADRYHRVRIISASCAIWSLFTASCGLATGFATLALARIGVGIGEAGGTPPSHSILADYFPPEKRGGALALYSLGVPIGTTLGTMIGAWVAAEHGWRTAFLAVGLPGLAAALVVLLFVREPERGRLDRIKGASDQRLLSSIVRYFRSPLLVLAALGGAFASFVWIAMLSWMPPLLLRTKGMTLGDVAAYYSVVTGVASLSGAVAGGFIADRWGRTNPRSYALVPCITLIVSIPFYLIALWLSDWRLIMVVLVVPFTAYAMFMAPTIALIHNSVEPSRRAMCSAIYLFIINLIGTGGGPLTVGWLSDHFAAEHGLSALPVAMTVVTPVFLLAAATYALAARRIRGPAR